jgi:uncharacterized protein
MKPGYEPVWAFYDAVARGDVDGVLATLHSDLAWTEAEGFPYYSGTWHSPGEVVEKLLVPLSRDWKEFSATPADHIAQGDRVVVLGHYSGTAKATGKSMRAAFAHVWRVRDDKIASFDMYSDTALVRAALQD